MTRRWPDALRLPMAIDAAALAADLAGLEGERWISHFVQQNYEGDWSVLPLRAPAGANHPILQIAPPPGCTDWVETPLLDRCPAIRALLRSFPCPVEAARLMRLAPGSVIKEHRDLAMAAEEGTARLHLPLRTNAGVDFRLNGRRVPMGEGTLWYLRLDQPHSVRNDGDVARVHLVFDLRVDPWLEALLTTAAQA